MINPLPEDTLNWQNEAEAIIKDVGDHVTYIAVSNKLKSDPCEIYLNLTTLENKNFCIRASGNGFQVVAEEFDKVIDKEPNEDDEIFETPYALLNNTSPRYVESFANRLISQLENI